jgi:hypothetical protein
MKGIEVQQEIHLSKIERLILSGREIVSLGRRVLQRLPPAMNNHTESIAGLALTISTLGLCLLVSSISMLVLVTIAYYYNKDQRKSDEKIALMLSASIYLVIFTLMMVNMSTHIQTILGDLYGDDFNSSWCIFRGFLLTLLPCLLYHLFVVQALFRLCRIVYSSRRRLQSFRFYILAVPAQVLFAILFTCPFLVWHSEQYLPNEHYCFISLTQYHSVVWSGFATYGNPMLLICLIYLRIVLFLRRQSGLQTFLVQRRQKRDLVAIRRILIIIGCLTVTGFPTTVLVLIYIITGQEHPLMYRIIWFSVAVAMLGLSIAMTFASSELKSLIRRIWLRNQIAPLRTTEVILHR